MDNLTDKGIKTLERIIYNEKFMSARLYAENIVEISEEGIYGICLAIEGDNIGSWIKVDKASFEKCYDNIKKYTGLKTK